MFQLYSKVIQLYIYIYPLFLRFYSHIRHYRVLSRVPCAIHTVGPYYLFFGIYLFIYFWLCWVFVAACGLSLVATSGGYSSLWCTGFSYCGAWALGVQASVVVARGLSSCGSRALQRRLSSCGARA